MNCEKIHKMIPGYLAGALEAAEAEVVRLHLEACEACRREVQTHNKVWDMVASLPELQPKQDFTASVRERLQKSTQPSRPLHRRRVRAALVVAASLLLGFGLYMLVSHFPTSPTIPVEPPVADGGILLTAAERAEIVRNLDLLENYDNLAHENLRAEDIDVLKKEEFLTVEELADRGIDIDVDSTASTSASETDDK